MFFFGAVTFPLGIVLLLIAELFGRTFYEAVF
jgi:hypothetical protein